MYFYWIFTITPSFNPCVFPTHTFQASCHVPDLIGMISLQSDWRWFKPLRELITCPSGAKAIPNWSLFLSHVQPPARFFWISVSWIGYSHPGSQKMLYLYLYTYPHLSIRGGYLVLFYFLGYKGMVGYNIHYVSWFWQSIKGSQVILYNCFWR